MSGRGVGRSYLPICRRVMHYDCSGVALWGWFYDYYHAPRISGIDYYYSWFVNLKLPLLRIRSMTLIPLSSISTHSISS